MPPDDPLRVSMGLAALPGGIFWSVFYVVTMWRAGEKPLARDWALAGVNVLASFVVGGLVAYFLGPVIVSFVPIEGLRDPVAVGFGIGAFAWEAAPFVYKGFRGFADRKAGGLGQ